MLDMNLLEYHSKPKKECSDYLIHSKQAKKKLLNKV